MREKVCLIVLIGLPAAGKSSFCQWLLNNPQNYYNIIRICYDDFLQIHQLASQEVYGTLDSVYKSQRIEIFKAIETISSHIENSKEIPENILKKIKTSSSLQHKFNADYIIVCDDNHYYRSMRYKLYQLCKAQSYAFAQIFFECGLQLALNRNVQRNFESRLPEHVITQMAERLEVPVASNIWEKNTITVRSSNFEFKIDTFILLVQRAFNDISENHASDHLTPHHQTDETQENSIIHKVDIQLRRRIGEILRLEHTKESKSSRAIQLNTKRKKILQKCRENGDSDDSQINKYIDSLIRNS